MAAVQDGDIKKIIWWLSHRADVNCEYPKGTGKSPLHQAVAQSNADVVYFLLQVSPTAIYFSLPTPNTFTSAYFSHLSMHSSKLCRMGPTCIAKTPAD